MSASPRSFLSVLTFFCFIVFSLNLLADEPSFRDFDDYQGILSSAQITKRLNLLVKSPELRDHFVLTQDTFSLFASAKDKAANNPEYQLQLGNKARPASLERRRRRNTERPLADLKIAIDPGHIGGPYARLEERFIDMKGKETIQFDEGTLTVATALYLKERLEEAGATVLLTREKPGQFVAPLSFQQWRQSKAFEEAVEAKISNIQDEAKRKAARDWYFKEAPESTLFRLLYNNEDIRARAEIINEFAPDLTLDIHYNAAAGNDKKTGQNLGTDKDYNMVFVPGSFMKGELSERGSRYEFMRLLVSDDLERSIALSAELVKALERNLRNETAKFEEPTAPYLKSACIPAGPNGVFCRNLGITRLVHSPLAYGESICQDNLKECRLLAQTDFEIGGIKTSSSIKVVADAYFRAILAIYGRRE